MATGHITRIVIFDEKLYRGNGDVIKWTGLITRHFGEHAVRSAPMRSGQLKAGIYWATHQVAPRMVEGAITSSSGHTLFVLRGTTGPIRTTLGYADPGGRQDPVTGKRQSGYYLSVQAGNGHPHHIAFQVSGQSPNNFFLKAWRATARNHHAIKGHIPSFIANP